MEDNKNTFQEQEEETTPVTEETEETAEKNTAEEAAEETAPETEEAPAEEKTKTSFFGKKKKENKYEQQIEELTDRLKRNMAEFDNFRKRTEKEKASMYIIGAKDIVEHMLPVVDNFERGLAAIPEDEKEGPVASGMEMIYKQMMTTLEGLGVTPIEALNKPFDPNFHNAVMHVEDDEVEESTVVEEFQKGYIYKEHVIRYSMVKVAN